MPNFNGVSGVIELLQAATREPPREERTEATTGAVRDS
jgi:hypothetical protein